MISWLTCRWLWCYRPPCPALRPGGRPSRWFSAFTAVGRTHTQRIWGFLQNVNISLDLLSAKRCHACLQGWRARPSKVWSPYRPARFSTHFKKNPFRHKKRLEIYFSRFYKRNAGPGWWVGLKVGQGQRGLTLWPAAPPGPWLTTAARELAMPPVLSILSYLTTVSYSGTRHEHTTDGEVSDLVFNAVALC